jgi:hypothetical protein
MSKSTMQIEANFDVAQVSPNLECRFKRQDAQGNPLTGKNAGSVAFGQGDDVYIQVNAGGDIGTEGKLPFKSFKIIDFTITSRPRVYRCGPNEKKTVYAPPSLFNALLGAQPRGATTVVPASEFNLVPVVGPDKYYQQGMLWSGKLTVGQVKARWRLTLMVTVQIEYEDAAPEMRVYEIDPEVEVDNGSGRPPGEDDPEPVAMAMCATDPETEVDNGSGRPPAH